MTGATGNIGHLTVNAQAAHGIVLPDQITISGVEAALDGEER